MATTKTPLGLNQWELDEKLKMDDFNSDNRIIDEKLRGHTAGLDTLDQKVDTTEARLTGQMNDVDARLTDQMDALSDQLGGQMNDLNLRMDDLSQVVFYNATATYTSGIFTLLGLPDNLPALYTVRFIAPADYTYGDRVQVGSQAMNVVTLDGGAPLTDAFKAGVLVSMDIHGTGGRAFFKQGGGSGTAGYGILPSQTQIQVTPGNTAAQVTLSNVGGDAYAGTKLVCKLGEDMPQTQTDGQIYDAGQSGKYTMTGLVNQAPYTVRAFAYNHSGEVQTDANGAVVVFTPKEGTPLGDLPTGSIIRVKENGVLADFKVAQHNYIQSGVTAIERVLCLSQTVAFNSANVNTYNGGTLDTFLTGIYRNMLHQNVRDALVLVDIPVTPGNGNYTVTTIPRDVFVFSGAEVGISFHALAVEGSQVDMYADGASRIKYSDDAPLTARWRWTRSSSTSSNRSAVGVNIIGNVASDLATSPWYIAPVLTLPSTLFLSPDNELLF